MKVLYFLIMGLAFCLLFWKGKNWGVKECQSNLEDLIGKNYGEIEKSLGKPYWYGTMDFGMAYGKWEIDDGKIELFFRENIVESIERLL